MRLKWCNVSHYTACYIWNNEIHVGRILVSRCNNEAQWSDLSQDKLIRSGRWVRCHEITAGPGRALLGSARPGPARPGTKDTRKRPTIQSAASDHRRSTRHIQYIRLVHHSRGVRSHQIPKVLNSIKRSAYVKNETVCSSASLYTTECNQSLLTCIRHRGKYFHQNNFYVFFTNLE